MRKFEPAIIIQEFYKIFPCPSNIMKPTDDSIVRCFEELITKGTRLSPKSNKDLDWINNVEQIMISLRIKNFLNNG